MNFKGIAGLFLAFTALLLSLAPQAEAQSMITGSLGPSVKIREYPTHEFKVSHLVGNRTLALPGVILNGRSENIQIDLQAPGLSGQINTADAGGHLIADLRILKVGTVAKPSSGRNYVFVEGALGRYYARLELDYKPGLAAITGSAAMDPERLPPTPYKILIGHRDEILYARSGLAGDKRLAQGVDPANWGRKSRPGGKTITLKVPANQPWTDTGLFVDRSTRLRIRAWGRVKYADPASRNMIGPEGTHLKRACHYLCDRADTHALVANVARTDPNRRLDGKGFTVGSSFRGRVPDHLVTSPRGRLYLGFNDGGVICESGRRVKINNWGFRGDNSGAFSVEIRVRPGN